MISDDCVDLECELGAVRGMIGDVVHDLDFWSAVLVLAMMVDIFIGQP